VLVDRAFISTKVTVDGKHHALVGTSAIRLSFREGQIGIQAGCNSMGGPMAWSGSQLTVTQLVSTEMGCSAPLMEQDQWVAKLFTSGASLSLTGDRLIVTSGSTVVDLTDEKTLNPDRPLVGTRWYLDSVIDGDVASSADASGFVVVTGKAVDVSNVCSRGTGPVSVKGGRLTFGALAWVTMPCPSGAHDAMPKAATFFAGDVSYSIKGSTLTLVKGARSFVYRAK
jgi:heat shock protein HslJ